MFESNYNYVPNPYPPAPAPGPGPNPWIPPHPPIPPGPGPGPMPPIYVDPTLKIPGAAADASVTGKLISSKVDLEAFTGNIQIINGKIELLGMAEAQVGQVPSKGSDGNIAWITPPTTEDIERLNSQISTINSALTEVNSDIDQLFETNSAQTEAIADLRQMVLTNNAKVEAVESAMTELANTVDGLIDSKLDTETFTNFLEQYDQLMNDPDEGLLKRLATLEADVDELKNCCTAVQQVLGDVHNYEEPIYQTLQDFETHAQAMNRDIDGGDLDDIVVGVAVPDVVGKNAAVANLILGQAGFFTNASLDGESYAGNLVVVSQDPAAESLAPEGSVVDLECIEGGQG